MSEKTAEEIENC